jgi:hypothetical protein
VDVPALMSEWEGDEEELLEQIMVKYKVRG